MEEQIEQKKIKKDFTVGIFIFIELLILFPMGFIYFLTGVYHENPDPNIFVAFCRLLLGFISAYAIFLSIRKFIKNGKGTTIWYFILILFSLFAFLSALFPAFSLFLL